MMKRLFYNIIAVSTVVLPIITSAASTLREVTEKFVDIVSRSLLPLLFTIALAWFIWGIVDFIRGADNQSVRDAGKRRMLWGIIGLLAMVGYISLVGVFSSTFFSESPGLPQLKGQ
ncbi:hypothetical protein KC901_00820 [Patescibacteria group bacterium]|nr:hypothetical protein [Patescibacteria group bacterium]